MKYLKMTAFSVVIIIIIIAIREIYLTRETIIFKLKNRGSNGIPTIKSNLSLIEEYSKNIPNFQDYTFIDIGCGEGKVLDYVYSKKLYKNHIGIELETKMYNIATKNLSDKKIQIHNIDAGLYDFKNVPTVIYMNEPLYCIDRINSYLTYEKWFRKFKKIDNIYIIYLTASTGKYLLDSKAIEKYNFKIIKQKKIGGIFINRIMNLVEKSNSI
tara:strand:+ start:5246 stop:5884 length:639 start_codon:yes stop_codon:yes gene_type:complete